MRKLMLICLLLLLTIPILAQDEPTPYDIALQRIEEAQRTNATELDLSGLGLTVLPPEIGSLTYLIVLWLDDNELKNLPPEIGNLSNLQELFLSNNQLRVVPPEIGNLTNLQLLYLGGHQLSEIPPEIGNLTELRWLSLIDNQLRVVPPEIGNLSNLRQLYLAGNQLSEIPPEIGYLTNLEHMEVDGNPLVSPPMEVVEQGQLAIMDYLQDELVRREAEKQRLMLIGAGGVGLFAALMLGFRLKQRGQRKSKKKRDE